MAMETLIILLHRILSHRWGCRCFGISASSKLTEGWIRIVCVRACVHARVRSMQRNPWGRAAHPLPFWLQYVVSKALNFTRNWQYRSPMKLQLLAVGVTVALALRTVKREEANQTAECDMVHPCVQNFQSCCQWTGECKGKCTLVDGTGQHPPAGACGGCIWGFQYGRNCAQSNCDIVRTR